MSGREHGRESDLLIHLIQPSAFLPEDIELPLARGNQTGTGPSSIKNEATEVVLDRFDHYYLGTPSIQRVTSTIQHAPNSMDQLLRGDIDMVTSVPRKPSSSCRTTTCRSYRFHAVINTS
jgi:MarR-like DNA-binding transcriptional regulator SgrR of sgrS sRNA